MARGKDTFFIQHAVPTVATLSLLLLGAIGSPFYYQPLTASAPAAVTALQLVRINPGDGSVSPQSDYRFTVIRQSKLSGKILERLEVQTDVRGMFNFPGLATESLLTISPLDRSQPVDPLLKLAVPVSLFKKNTIKNYQINLAASNPSGDQLKLGVLCFTPGTTITKTLPRDIAVSLTADKTLTANLKEALRSCRYNQVLAIIDLNQTAATAALTFDSSGTVVDDFVEKPVHKKG